MTLATTQFTLLARCSNAREVLWRSSGEDVRPWNVLVDALVRTKDAHKGCAGRVVNARPEQNGSSFFGGREVGNFIGLVVVC